MGCVTSKKDINDLHPNVFQVSNVDDLGNALSSGELEVTVSELVLHQRGKPPIRWPLKSLRRYGYDSQVFSFEAGRRCPTGSGIYAFSCQRAEQLFNFVQAHAQIRSNEDTMSRDNGTPTASGVSLRHHNQQQQQDTGNYLEPAPPPLRHHTLPTLSIQPHNNNNNTNSNNNNNGISSRLSSVGSSNGCQSPSSPLTATTITPTNNTNYANEEIFRLEEKCRSPVCEGECDGMTPVYMNVVAGLPPPSDVVDDEEDEEEEEARHCYANLTPGELALEELPAPPPLVVRSVNYIVLDLDAPQPPASPHEASSPPHQLPAAASSLPAAPSINNNNNNNNNNNGAKLSEGYVTIDFDRTVALSHSVNPSYENDSECLRKTRHNSTIASDHHLAPPNSRHSASLTD